MHELLQQAASGVAMGGIYACLAVALVMIYQSTSHINFAQGEMAMFSTFVALYCLKAGMPYAVAALVAIVFGFLSGFIIERTIIKRLHNAPGMSFIVALIALFIGINSLGGWIFGHQLEAFPSPFGTQPPFENSFISAHEFGTLVVVIIVVALLYSFLRFTRLGLAMRAAAENAESSRLSGVPVSLLMALGWGISAAIGTVAGLLVAPVVFLDPHMMGGVLIYAFAAALLGGLDNPWGAIVGGIIVGVVENLAGTYLVGTELKLSVALVVIVGVLLVRPSGLFGRKLVSRV